MDNTGNIFAQLVDMGFDAEVSSAASNAAVSVEEAVTIAMGLQAVNASQDVQVSQPGTRTLHLNSPNALLAQQQQAMAQYSPGLSNPIPSPQQPHPQQPPTTDETHAPEDEITSRYKERRADYIDTAAKVEIARMNRFKAEGKSAKAQLLKQIAEDRAAKKAFGKGLLPQEPVAQSLASVSTTVPASASPTSTQTATIQFRLPSSLVKDSPTIKHVFASQDKLAIVFLYLRATLAIPTNHSLQLLSSFPRKVWDEADDTAKSNTIKDAGLTPSASLNLVLIANNPGTPAQPFTTTHHNATATTSIPQQEIKEVNIAGGGDISDDDDVDMNDVESNGENEDIHNEPLEEPEEDDEDAENDDDNGDMDLEFGGGGQRLGGGGGQRLGGGGGHVLGGPARVRPVPLPLRQEEERNIMGAGPGIGHVGVGGHRLGGNSAPETQNPIPIAPQEISAIDNGRALRLAAIQNRVAIVEEAGIPDTTNLTIRSSRKVRNPLRLLDLALHAVVTLLSQHGNKKTLKAHQLSSVRHLGSDLAEMVLKAAKTGRKLDRAFIGRLSQCPVTAYDLDSYGLATDSLLETIGFTHYLTLDRLSLKGCSIITDEGIFAIQTCRHITHLDLSSCRLTDTIFSYLTSFPSLAFLSLSRTKITSKALKKFADSPSAPHDTLQVLILMGCQGINSSKTLQDLAPFTSKSLHTLSLQGCPLVGPLVAGSNAQDVRSGMNSLNVLDVSHVSGLVDSDLTLFSMFPNLLELDLTGAGAMSVVEMQNDGVGPVVKVVGFCSGAGDVVSKGLRDLTVRLPQLQCIKLPHKGDVGIDTVLRGFSGLNSGGSVIGEALHLNRLDMDGFVHLTDSGIAGISRFQETLRVLCLSGTQVSDNCVQGIGELKGLAELNLDRTVVGNPIFAAIKDLMLLEVLSLCETEVSDAGLKQMSTCRFRFTLKRLNLAKTVVTHVGIAKGLLGYDHLVSLNVERSGVVGVEMLLNLWETESKKAGFRLSDAILSGNGVRWAAEPVAVPEMEEED